MQNANCPNRAKKRLRFTALEFNNIYSNYTKSISILFSNKTEKQKWQPATFFHAYNSTEKEDFFPAISLAANLRLLPAHAASLRKE